MEVRYIEIKTSPAGQIIRAYTPEQYKKEMARRKNAAARACKSASVPCLHCLDSLCCWVLAVCARSGRSSVMAWPGCSCSFSAYGWPTGFTGRPTRRSGCVNPYKDMTLAARRARESRWKAKTCSRVVHPRFGEVIVPHTSNYAAMLNAAEYWGCDWLEIIDDVEVWAVGPDAVPVKMPRR